MNYSSPLQNKCVIYCVYFRRCHSGVRSSVSETVCPARHGHIYQVQPAVQSFMSSVDFWGHIGQAQRTHAPFTHTLHLEPPIKLTRMFLSCGRKLGYLEKTPMLPASCLINCDWIKVNYGLSFLMYFYSLVLEKETQVMLQTSLSWLDRLDHPPSPPFKYLEFYNSKL